MTDTNPTTICHVNADATSPATTAARTSHNELNQHRSHHRVPHLAPCHMVMAGVAASAARFRNCEPPAAALASRVRWNRSMLVSSVALRLSARILPPPGRHQSRAPTAGTTTVKNTPAASRPQPIHFGPSPEPGRSFNLSTIFMYSEVACSGAGSRNQLPAPEMHDPPQHEKNHRKTPIDFCF